MDKSINQDNERWSEYPEEEDRAETIVPSVDQCVEEEVVELSDSWPSYAERLDSFVKNDKCTTSVQGLDERRREIFDRLRQKFKNTPKPLLQRLFYKKSHINVQLEDSVKKLDEILRFGNDLVTNILIANESRELKHKKHEKTQRELLKANLNRETIESMARFENIKSRWTELSKTNEPMMLFNQLEAQKARIADVMKSKDAVIEQCQLEVSRMAEKFDSDIEKQNNEVSCLVERINNQVELMKNAYRKHVAMLSDAIEDERQLFYYNAHERYCEYFGTMQNDVQTVSDALKTRDTYFLEDILRIAEEQDELTKNTRLRLEKDCEMLELELRKTRDNVLTNSEKLDYNYQVLQKKNEENVIVNNQQKRRVAKLHENVAMLRRKIATTTQIADVNAQRLVGDIEKLHWSITEIEAKSHYFRMENKSKFDRIWAMNYKDITELVLKTYEIDRLLYEQQLLLPWSQPKFDMSDINELKHRKKPRSDCTSKPKSSNAVKAKTADLSSDEVRFLRNIMRKLSNRGGFLLEDKLIDLLEPYTERDNRVVRIENIFHALRVRNLKDVRELMKVFGRYSYCPNCGTGITRDFIVDIYMHDRPERKEMAKSVADYNRVKAYKSVEHINCPNHYIVMEKALVLHAITVFAAQKRYEITVKSKEIKPDQINYIAIKDDDIRAFWAKFKNCIPEEKLKLWNTLQHGLNHYLDVLKLRKQYNAECQFLRKQNKEFRYLLQKFQI